jgi:hypothetical protein
VGSKLHKSFTCQILDSASDADDELDLTRIIDHSWFVNFFPLFGAPAGAASIYLLLDATHSEYTRLRFNLNQGPCVIIGKPVKRVVCRGVSPMFLQDLQAAA